MNTNEYFVSKDKEVEKLETEGAFSPALDLVKFLFCRYFCLWEYNDEDVRLATHLHPVLRKRMGCPLLHMSYMHGA